MGWICKFCSTYNTDEASACIVCDKPRSYKVTCTLTPARVARLGLSGDVVVPKEYNVIGADAFRDRTDITSVTLHSGVCKIEKGAFYGCGNLRSVVTSAELRSIGEQAFCGCRSLPTADRPKARYVAANAFDDAPAVKAAPSAPEESRDKPSALRRFGKIAAICILSAIAFAFFIAACVTYFTV